MTPPTAPAHRPARLVCVRGQRRARLAAHARRCGRRAAAGGRSGRRVAFGLLSLRSGGADRVGRRRGARSHGGAELLRRGGRARPQRERGRRLLRPKTAAAGSPAGRRRGGADRAGDRRVGGVERDGARAFHHRADHRFRPAAGIDLLSDGGRRALHDDFRLRAILSTAAAGSCVRDRRRAGSGRRGIRLALHRDGRRALGPADARRLRRLPRRRRAHWVRAGVHRADLHLDRWRASGNDLRPADGARASTISSSSRSRSSSSSAT